MLLGELVVLIVSLTLLLQSSHMVIKAAIKIARFTKLGEFVIGFILLAVVTSLPEMFLSLSAILTDNIGISIGNLLGSNIADIGLIVGLAAIMSPLVFKKSSIKALSGILLVTSIILILLSTPLPSKFVGFLLIITFIGFVYFSVRKKITVKRRDHTKPKEILPTIFLFLIGIVILLVSSRYAVISAAEIARTVGLSEAVIGATILAVGTSLPELTITINALRKGFRNLAIGNAMGSTLTNLTLVLGTVLLVTPFQINFSIFSMLLTFVLIMNMFLWYFVSSGKIRRIEGIVLLSIYIIFLIALLTTQVIIT